MPLLIVTPTYPPSALAEGKSAQIEIRGTITKEGMLESPVFANSPEEEEFANAIREVLPAWRFIPAANGTACAAKEMPDATVRAWFEVKEGRPAIFVSIPPDKKEASKETPPSPRMKWKRRPDVEYPWDELRDGVEGIAYALARVDASGQIKEVNILASSPGPAFGASVLKALPSAMYEPPDTKDWKKETICAKIDFIFCVRGSARYHIAQCGSR